METNLERAERRTRLALAALLRADHIPSSPIEDYYPRKLASLREAEVDLRLAARAVNRELHGERML